MGPFPAACALYRFVDGLVALAGGDDMNLTNKLNALEVENKQLKKATEDLKSLVSRLEARVAKLEVSGGSPAKPSAGLLQLPLLQRKKRKMMMTSISLVLMRMKRKMLKRPGLLPSA